MRPFLIILTVLSACADSGIANPVDMGTADTQTLDDMRRTDVKKDEPQSMCSVCCSGDVRCASDSVREVCLENGSGFDAVPCDDGDVCTNGLCAAAQVCEPGSTSCQDGTTLLTCRATGAAYTASPCSDGEACSGGRCSDGAADGVACSQNDDCASGVCHCGGEEACPDIMQGYCATKGCTEGSCGPNAVCLDSAKAPFQDAAQNYDHCVTRCDGEICPEAPFACSQVPVKDEAGDWSGGCYFPEVFPIGGDCANDTRCLGGLCRTDFFSESNFCTRDCSTDGVCPPDSACVELDTDMFFCSLLCGDGSVVGLDPCPLDQPTDRFDVTCKNFATFGGGAKRVCATP